MVALSELNLNLFDKLSNYNNKHKYIGVKPESQDFTTELSLSSDSTSISKRPSSERVISKLVQRQKRLSTDEVSEIVNSYKSGLNIYQLAKQYNCHRTTISYHLKEHGVKMRNRPLSEAQVNEAVKLYESGLSCLKIGKIIGADDTTILRRLRERGVGVRGAHERMKHICK